MTRLHFLVVLALAGVGAAVYFGRIGDGATIRNDSVAFDLENLYVEVEEGTLAFERALLRGDGDGLRLRLAKDASAQVPSPMPATGPLDLFEHKILGPDTMESHQGRDAVVAAWGSYLVGYSIISDVRFKLKSFDNDQAWERRADATIALEVRGVLRSGETVQDEVKYTGVLVREAQGWLVRDLAMQQRTLRLAPQRLFTQVTRAAGMEMHIGDRFNAQGPIVNHDVGSTNATNLDYGGIACADVDGDDRLDVYVANAHGVNYLFLNKGDGTFEEAAEAAGVRANGGSRGAVFADIDNDGDQDLFVTKAAFHYSQADPSSNQLFENDGSGRFTDVTAESGLELAAECFTPTFLDFDLDGDLDLYICRYGHMGLRPPGNYFETRNGEPNVLYRNLGDGRFEVVPDANGAADTGWSYAVAVCDYDNDGWPDIYVANDYGPNRLYRNNGAGWFEETQEVAGVTDNGNGMGAAWVDNNDDGRFDLYVTNMSSTTGDRILSAAPITDDRRRELMLKFTKGNSFFRANADGSFDSVGEDLGVAHCGWAWHADFLDVDRDADEDLFVVNGYITGVTEKDY